MSDTSNLVKQKAVDINLAHGSNYTLESPPQGEKITVVNLNAERKDGKFNIVLQLDKLNPKTDSCYLVKTATVISLVIQRYAESDHKIGLPMQEITYMAFVDQAENIAVRVNDKQSAIIIKTNDPRIPSMEQFYSDNPFTPEVYKRPAKTTPVLDEAVEKAKSLHNAHSAAGVLLQSLQQKGRNEPHEITAVNLPSAAGTKKLG